MSRASQAGRSHDGDLYDKLETRNSSALLQRPDEYVEMMRSTIALNGSFFNTQRMVAQYAMNAYFNGYAGASSWDSVSSMRWLAESYSKSSA